MIKAVIFDMDGLLLDTEKIYEDAWIEYGVNHNFPIDKALVATLRGQNEANIKKRSQKFLGGEFVFEKARDYCFEYLYKKIDAKQVAVKTGATQLLDYLKENNFKIALATSSSEKIATACLNSANIYSYFDVLTFGNMVENSKPAPDIFLLAAQLLGVDITDCVILEDSYNGVSAAHASNAVVCMIPDIDMPTKEISQKTDSILSDLLQVIEFIENKNSSKGDT